MHELRDDVAGMRTTKNPVAQEKHFASVVWKIGSLQGHVCVSPNTAPHYNLSRPIITLTAADIAPTTPLLYPQTHSSTARQNTTYRHPSQTPIQTSSDKLQCRTHIFKEPCQTPEVIWYCQDPHKNKRLSLRSDSGMAPPQNRRIQSTARHTLVCSWVAHRPS